MAPETGSAVALAGVRRTFGDVLAVDDLTFEVPRGTVTVLLGPKIVTLPTLSVAWSFHR